MGRGSEDSTSPSASPRAARDSEPPIEGEEFIHIAPRSSRQAIREQGLLPGTHVWEDPDGASQFHCEMEGTTMGSHPVSWFEPYDEWLVIIPSNWRRRKDPNYRPDAGAFIIQRAIPPWALTLTNEQPWFRSDDQHLRSLEQCDECGAVKEVGELYCGGATCAGYDD